MKVLDDGHNYEIDNIDGSGKQTISFVRCIPASEAAEGTLMQELYRVLIHHTNFLNEQVPCHENIRILQNLRENFVLLEARATRRKIERETYPERVTPCGTCGHTLCNCGDRK